jgi:hypothetical protein
MSEDEKDDRDNWRYLLLLEYEKNPVWLEAGRLPGVPEGTTRIKVGNQYYFLDASSLFYDDESKKMICFLAIRQNVLINDVQFGPDGKQKQNDTETDTYAFMRDNRFKQIAAPF